MDDQTKQQVQQMIDQSVKQSFTTRRIGDTPTDALQLTNKKYVDGSFNPYSSSVLTLTNKRYTSRVSSVVSNSSIAIDINKNDGYRVHALATGTTFSFTGTPTDQQKLLILLKDNNAQQTLGWPAAVSNYTSTIPSVTTTSSIMVIGLVYDLSPSVWGCILS